MADMDDQIVAARAMLAANKTWVGSDIRWVKNAKLVPGMKFQSALALDDGRQPQGLFVAGYFKQSQVAGNPDKLYVNLVYGGKRIHAVHENGYSNHLNTVGRGEQHYMDRIAHPHRHRICDEAVEGYAEPIAPLEPTAMWTMFLQECNISGAPGLAIPVTQLGLPL